jgi:hypothetical protein
MKCISKSQPKTPPIFKFNQKFSTISTQFSPKIKKKAKKADYSLTFRILLHKIVAGGNNEQN